MGHNGQLKHGMNCSGLIPGREDECTCGLRYRIETQTEQTLKDAWIKRATEAEKQLLIVDAELEKANDDIDFFKRLLEARHGEGWESLTIDEANKVRIKEQKSCV